MFNPVRNIIRRAVRKPGEKYNILVCPAHSPVECEISRTGHEFYGFQDENILAWNYCRQVPANYHLLERGKKDESLPKDVDFDFCLSHNTEAHQPYLKRYAKLFGIPLVQVYHTCPPLWVPHWQQYVQASKQRFAADINVFITESNREQWGFTEDEGIVIQHSANTVDFKPLNLERQNYVLTVANMYRSRDYALGYRLYEAITQGMERQHVGADEDANFSQPIQDATLLNAKLNECGAFLNTSIFSPIPCSLIEAALVGCPIVSAATCEIPLVFSHKNDILLYPPDKPELAKKYLQQVLTDRDFASKLGSAARETALRVFDPERFVSQWNNVFNQAANMVVTGV